MSTEVQRTAGSTVVVWLGRILTALVGLLLIASGVFKLLVHFEQVPSPPRGNPDIDWPVENLLLLGIIEISCALIYLIPRASILGAILLTGYMGGAIAVHMRVHDYYFIQAIIGVLVWTGIYMRCGRLRALIPFRT